MKTAAVCLTLLAGLLVLSSCGFAQDAPCNDSFCFCVGDVGCAYGECTQFPPDSCTSSTLTVPCTASYKIVAKVICANPNDPCANCESCMYIYPTDDPDNIVSRCHTNGCPTGNCTFSCNVALSADVNYTMAVCLVVCPGHTPPWTCNDCGTLCKAYGCVYRNVITECVPL